MLAPLHQVRKSSDGVDVDIYHVQPATRRGAVGTGAPDSPDKARDRVQADKRAAARRHVDQHDFKSPKSPIPSSFFERRV